VLKHVGPSESAQSSTPKRNDFEGSEKGKRGNRLRLQHQKSSSACCGGGAAVGDLWRKKGGKKKEKWNIVSNHIKGPNEKALMTGPDGSGVKIGNEGEGEKNPRPSWIKKGFGDDLNEKEKIPPKTKRGGRKKVPPAYRATVENIHIHRKTNRDV